MYQVFSIAHYELMHIFRRKLLLLMVFIVPVGYAALFGSIYASGVLANIPVAVVDLDGSAQSREVREAFANSPKFVVAEDLESYSQLRTSMEDGRVRAGIVIPEDFEADATRNRGTEVLTVYDASNLIWGYNIRKNALEVVNQFNVGRVATYLTGLGMDENSIVDTLDTISSNFEIWYNPSLSYATFIYMGFVLMIIHQIGLMVTAISVTRDKEENSWVHFLSASVPAWKIFLGKSLPYFVTNMFNYALLILIAAELFNVKVIGHAYLLILLGIIYNIVIASVGFLVSVYARDSLQVTRYVMLLSTPFFLISGLTWPSSYVSGWVNVLAKATPFAWMAEGMRRVTVKNLGFEYIQGDLIALSIMAFVSVFLCISFSKGRKPRVEEVSLRS